MGYGHEVQYYRRDSFKAFNYQKHMFNPTFYYHITPKTSIFGGYTFGVVDYFAGGTYESNFNTASVGIVGELTPKSSIRFETGYELRNYHDEAAYDDKGEFTLSLTYANKYSRKTGFVVYAERSMIESTFEPNPYFVTTLGGIRWKHLLTPKITLSLEGVLMYNDYPEATIVNDREKNRYDWYYNTHGSVRYKITEWLDSGLMYELKQRISNLEDQKYTDHVFMTDITARY
jgi:hypothetical protein